MRKFTPWYEQNVLNKRVRKRVERKQNKRSWEGLSMVNKVIKKIWISEGNDFNDILF